MRKLLSFVIVLALLPLVGGCAGNKINTVITMEPVIASQIQSVQLVVEGNKIGLQGASCGATDCYSAAKTDVGLVATYDKAFNQALTALNTTSAKAALTQMVAVIQDWINTRLIKLPANVQPFVLVALQSLSAGLAAANISLGG